jgi:hypothetical protein
MFQLIAKVDDTRRLLIFAVNLQLAVIYGISAAYDERWDRLPGRLCHGIALRVYKSGHCDYQL